MTQDTAPTLEQANAAVYLLAQQQMDHDRKAIIAEAAAVYEAATPARNHPSVAIAKAAFADSRAAEAAFHRAEAQRFSEAIETIESSDLNLQAAKKELLERLGIADKFQG